ncbi:MAG: glycoside hydrolase family 27 protein [Porphyromonas sp.]|nr:glycoside hydrolase family 27 protein [Bacteroidales bacterium]MDY3101015.1 glycoside hydrolase family 27 protein [Porphyromonas sp.]
MKKVSILTTLLFLSSAVAFAQTTDRSKLAPTPPMGWMSWNFFGEDINEENLKATADLMVSEGFLDAGYEYLFIDDCWQGGRDNRNNIIADPVKFPSGIKALADYVHSKGLKLGIYSDAAPLTCAGYTASLGFEEQDAKTFAEWDVDYLKYDYCGAPVDVETAKARYKKMADALTNSGRDIALGVCEWGVRNPATWAGELGGSVWRTSYDVRDMWIDTLKKGGLGIMDILEETVPVSKYARPGHWNDMDMLIVGLYGKGDASSDLGGVGCSDTEYQSQMSLWCMMASPLAMSNDLRSLNDETRRILLNKEVIAIDQDPLGKAAERVVKTDDYQVFLRPLSGDRYAIAILNTSDKTRNISVSFKDLSLPNRYKVRDVWAHKDLGSRTKWSGKVASHETKVFVLSK